ncbi:HAD family hydrolase [Clostridium paraputrificum]|uniref:HAD family hydrolase n=1 Tax=Clostridium paraputrificum TaxID=29363 RepID=UPI003D326A1A
MRYDWIIFDVDGTLIETARSNSIGLMITMKELFNKEYTEEEIRKYMGIPGDMALRNIGVKEEKIMDTWVYWGNKVKEYAHYNYVFEGVMPMLEELSKSYNLAIATSKTHQQLHDDFVQRGLLEYFKIWVCKEDTDKHKPNPEPLLKAMEKAKINKGQAIYIGDALVDYQAAKAANMDFGHCRFADKYDEVDCHITFNTAEGLKEYFIEELEN